MNKNLITSAIYCSGLFIYYLLLTEFNGGFAGPGLIAFAIILGIIFLIYSLKRSIRKKNKLQYIVTILTFLLIYPISKISNLVIEQRIAETQLKSKVLITAIEKYKMDFGYYPDTISKIKIPQSEFKSEVYKFFPQKFYYNQRDSSYTISFNIPNFYTMKYKSMYGKWMKTD